VVHGVGKDANIVSASIRAILSGLRRAPKGSLWPPDPVEMAPDGGNGQWSITLCQALPFLPGRAFYVGNQSVCEVCASVLQKNRMQKFVPRI
jgi:hypothetical protein